MNLPSLPVALLLIPFLFALSCGAAGSVAPVPLSTRETLAPVVPIAPAVTPPFATATPWPTFTPHPTPTWSYDFSVPTLAPPGFIGPRPTPVQVAPTPTPAPTPSGPLPTVSLDGFDVSGVLATPTPAYVQRRLPGLDVTLRRQTVFMSHLAQEPALFPAPRTVFYTRTARYIGWWVDFEYSNVDPAFEMTGLMRLLNVTSGELVMYQESFVLTHGRGLFLMLGDSVPGRLWFPGHYRFEAWDNRDRVMVHYDFEVRSGLLQ